MGPCDTKPGRNPFCLPSPHLCAHPLASKAKWVCGIKSWGAREEYVGLCSAKWSAGQQKMAVRFWGFQPRIFPCWVQVLHGVQHMTLNTLLSSLACAFVYLMYMCGSLTQAMTETTSDLCGKLPSSISSGWGKDTVWACFEISPLFNECYLVLNVILIFVTYLACWAVRWGGGNQTDAG